jgi:hypothetical protein
MDFEVKFLDIIGNVRFTIVEAVSSFAAVDKVRETGELDELLHVGQIIPTYDY